MAFIDLINNGNDQSGSTQNLEFSNENKKSLNSGIVHYRCVHIMCIWIFLSIGIIRVSGKIFIMIKTSFLNPFLNY